MRSIVELVDQPLQWTQPNALKMEYELAAGEDLVATLRFRSAFGSFATAESADGCWTFKRVGFWKTRATIRTCESGVEIATFKNNTWSGGGTLDLSDGRSYPVTTNLWQTRLDFLDGANQPLIQLKSTGLVRLSAAVEIHSGAARLAELPWMVLLGWYLTVMMYMDSTGSVAASV